MYWTLVTLTTTGYGDITPQTNLERSFTMCVELLGAVRLPARRAQLPNRICCCAPADLPAARAGVSALSAH